MHVLGLDIGGANLKAAHTDGSAMTRPFAVWKEPDKLPDTLADLVAAMPSHDAVAITMTAELCDCFATKRDGVHAILDAVKHATNRPTRIWSIDGFMDFNKAYSKYLRVASANWSVLARFAGRFAPNGSAILLDIGSTTTDIIPLANGQPTSKNWTDPERMKNLELIYTGVTRTPVCSLLGPRVAAEFFATTLDVNLLLNLVSQDPENTDTADGRPATKPAAHARMARMLCGDAETVSFEKCAKLAQRALLRQVQQLITAVEVVREALPEPPSKIVISGSGEFLARIVLIQMNAFQTDRFVSLSERLGDNLSQAACAYAVATLAAENP